MGEQPSQKVSQDELRRLFIEETVSKHERFLALLEHQVNFTFLYPLFTNGKDFGVVRFRRWTHEEANRLRSLPFIAKLVDKQSLTEDEELVWQQFQTEMVRDAVSSKFFDDPDFIKVLFAFISHASGLGGEFQKQLEEFMDTDGGKNYGVLWFTLLGKTPSEVASLPESDVQTITTWFARYAEKVRQNVQ